MRLFNVMTAAACIALAASVTWDPEPGGELGGDSVPNNTAAALPTIDAAWTLVVDGDGDGLPDLDASPVPDRLLAGARLLPNHPNPFNPSTTIAYEIPGEAATDVRLTIFDVRGRLVATLVDARVTPGLHRIVWDGKDQAGQAVASGTYFSQLKWGGRAITRPLSLVK